MMNISLYTHLSDLNQNKKKFCVGFANLVHFYLVLFQEISPSLRIYLVRMVATEVLINYLKLKCLVRTANHEKKIFQSCLQRILIQQIFCKLQGPLTFFFSVRAMLLQKISVASLEPGRTSLSANDNSFDNCTSC